MIINPVLNGLDPPDPLLQSDYASPFSPPLTESDDKLVEENLPPEDPPPYTSIDLGDFALVERSVTSTESFFVQFCRCHSVGSKDRSWSMLDTSPPVPAKPLGSSGGIQDIKDGGRQIVESIKLFAGTCLIVAGDIVEGFSKIVTGIGKAITYCGALMICKNH